MKIRHVASLFIVLMLSFSLVLLSACGNSNKENKATLESKAAGAVPADNKDGILKVALGTNPKILGYPAEITNNGPLPFLDPIIQSLGRFDEKGNLVPWLAESWQTDAAAKTITFKLKKGIKFSDGTDFNAEAVKWNIQTCIDAKRNEVANIQSMDVVDDSTIRINLKEWNSSSLEAIGYFIRYISPTAFKTHDKEWANRNPVGTGPFLLEKWEQNVSVKYKKNPNYWEKGKPNLDGIEMLIIEDPMTASSAMKSGEIDVWIAGGSVDIAKELIDSGKFDYVAHKNGIGAVGTGFIPDYRTPGSPFKDVKVRKALCYAIDEKKLAETFGKGFYVTTNQWGPPDTIVYNPDVKGYPYDPEKAKQLLAEAGFPNGFKTKIFTVPGTKDVFTAIQSYLAAVGINGELIMIDEAKQQSFYFNTWEGGLMGHYHSVQPDLGLYMFRHLDPNGAFYAKGIEHPDDVVKILKDIQTAPDAKTKQELSYKVQKLVYDEYCLVGKPLYVPMQIAIKQKYVKGDSFHIYHLSYWTPGDAILEKTK